MTKPARNKLALACETVIPLQTLAHVQGAGTLPDILNPSSVPIYVTPHLPQSWLCSR